MSAQSVINIVTTRCPPPDDAKFNRWYNEVHIPMLMKCKKLQGVERYKLITEPASGPAYIAIYRFASLNDYQEFNSGPELAAAGKEMRETWGQKIEIISRLQYGLIQAWQK
jgi:hypothetical protein